MNPKALLSQYELLSAEERFRLILAASGRNDPAERDRLVKAGKSRNHTFSDHWPYAQAFSEIASYVYQELVEDAARYHDIFNVERHAQGSLRQASQIRSRRTG